MINIFYFVIYAYLASAGMAALYFNYLYAVNNGFVAWLLFGELIATFQGFIWPLYYFQIL